jgi:predicted AAA+ superfamily ATPase
MYIRRALETVVLRATELFPVVLVTGPRQVGKTTMLKKLAMESRTYVSLDAPITRELAKTDPEMFLQRYVPPVLINEIQYAPELLPFIKIHVDTHKRMGDFWSTGSQMFHMMQNVSESLAGRVAVLRMQGLSNNEINGTVNVPYTTDFDSLMKRIGVCPKQNLKKVYDRIFTGSQPSAYAGDFDRELYYSAYVNTYLQRDIKDLTQVGDELAFLRFITACAVRTSQMLNYADLAKDVGISPPTAKQWLSILVSSGIVVLLEPYFNNILKRIIKSPNLYFMDTGLCAYLARWDSATTLEVSAMAGAFFETYTVSEIIKSYFNAGKSSPVFYYRDTDNKEIDLILEQNNTLYPIEIKKSANPGRDAIRHFGVLRNTGKVLGPGNVICLCNDLLPIDKENCFVPVWLI